MSRTTAVDPRGLRFVAGVSAVVLALVLVTPRPVALALLAVQAGVFATGALVDLRLSPWSRLYARLVRPRLGPPAELEDARAPTFAQAVGLTFAVVALLGFALGVPAVGLVATGLALVAALLNAAVGFCLGCEMYLLLRRFAPAGA